VKGDWFHDANAAGWGAPAPGLGGTGWLADDLYLLAHDERTGRLEQAGYLVAVAARCLRHDRARPARRHQPAHPRPGNPVTTARPGVVRAGPADTGALSHLIVAHAMTTGLVHTTSGREAVAVWLPAGPGASGPEPGYGQQLAAATAPWTGRFAVFD
jgi:hypothetical protein